jgi:predicted TIM-barrel fold metal-dependent hydrolase
MLYDSHIHFIPEELSIHTAFYKDVWTQKSKLYEFLDNHQIDKALLVYPSTDAHIKLGGYAKVCELYNRAVEEILKEKSKIVASAIVDIDNLDNISSQVKKLKEEGFKAISLASSYDGKFVIEQLCPLFEAAEKYQFTIFVHPQTINPIGFERVKDPLLMPVLEYSFDNSMFMGLLMMEGILEKFNINFIFASLGGVMPFLKDRLDRVYMMLRNRKMVKELGKLPSEILSKVFVDTSGSSLANIKLALELFGEDKVLWGSDYPVNTNIEENLKIFNALVSDVKEKITYKNFSKLFNL